MHRSSILEYGSPPLMRTASDGAQMLRASTTGRPPLPRRRSADDGDAIEVRSQQCTAHLCSHWVANLIDGASAASASGVQTRICGSNNMGHRPALSALLPACCCFLPKCVHCNAVYLTLSRNIIYLQAAHGNLVSEGRLAECLELLAEEQERGRRLLALMHAHDQAAAERAESLQLKAGTSICLVSCLHIHPRLPQWHAAWLSTPSSL